MNGIMKQHDYDVYRTPCNRCEEQIVCEQSEEKLISENCNASGFSLAAMAGGILFCLGIILYALLTV
jgi:hypothetical protein